MVFTVSIPNGMQDFDFDAVARQMRKKGISIANGPRVLDPVTQGRWLPALNSKAEAEEFAELLREDTEYDEWRVYSLPSVTPSVGPFGPIDIYISRRSDGVVYGLGGSSDTLIQAAFPDAALADIVHIRLLKEADFEKTHGPYWGYVAKILTGLSDEQIEQLGGYRIIDRKEKHIFRDVPFVPASTNGPSQSSRGGQGKKASR